MQSVNINQRETIESYYPLDSFVHDANQNARGKASVMHGLRILSAPDADGAFKVTKAQHNVAEDDDNQDALFLYSVRDDDNNWFDKGEADASKAVHAKEHPVDVSDLYRELHRPRDRSRPQRALPARHRTRRAEAEGVSRGLRVFRAIASCPDLEARSGHDGNHID